MESSGRFEETVEGAKLQQKLEYLQAEKTQALARCDYEKARTLVPEIAQTERDLVEQHGAWPPGPGLIGVPAALLKSRERARRGFSERDRRVIQNKVALKALLEKKKLLIGAVPVWPRRCRPTGGGQERYRELAALQAELDKVCAQLEEDGSKVDLANEASGAASAAGSKPRTFLGFLGATDESGASSAKKALDEPVDEVAEYKKMMHKDARGESDDSCRIS